MSLNDSACQARGLGLGSLAVDTTTHWVKALRENLGLTPSQMADEIGVSRGRISQLESTGGTLANEKLLAVWQRHGRRLKRLGFSLEDLLTARPEPTQPSDDEGAAA